MVGTGRISVQGIDEVFWSEFKDSVRERCGKLHTALGLEVEKALKLYQEGFSQTGDTHTHRKKREETSHGENLKQQSETQIPKGITVGKTRAERINNVGKMLMYGSAEITYSGLQRFIATQEVGDERVTESYIKTMKLKGWVMPRGKGAGVAVLRSTISKALDIPLPRETLEKMSISNKRWREANPIAQQKLMARAYGKRRKLGFIPISPTPNYPFEWHHIDNDRVIAVAAKIHSHVYHNAPSRLIEGELG